MASRPCGLANVLRFHYLLGMDTTLTPNEFASLRMVAAGLRISPERKAAFTAQGLVVTFLGGLRLTADGEARLRAADNSSECLSVVAIIDSHANSGVAAPVAHPQQSAAGNKRRAGRCAALLSLIGVLLASVPATAQEKGPTEERVFFEFFVGACLIPFPDLGRVRVQASVLGWKPITGDIAAALAPADPQARYQMWAASMPPRLFFVAISEGKVGRRSGTVCTTAGRGVNQDALAVFIEQNGAVTRLSDTIENLQRHRSWTILQNGARFGLELGTISGDISSPAVLSLVQLK